MLGFVSLGFTSLVSDTNPQEHMNSRQGEKWYAKRKLTAATTAKKKKKTGSEFSELDTGFASSSNVISCNQQFEFLHFSLP